MLSAETEYRKIGWGWIEPIYPSIPFKVDQLNGCLPSRLLTNPWLGGFLWLSIPVLCSYEIIRRFPKHQEEFNLCWASGSVLFCTLNIFLYSLPLNSHCFRSKTKNNTQLRASQELKLYDQFQNKWIMLRQCFIAYFVSGKNYQEKRESLKAAFHDNCFLWSSWRVSHFSGKSSGRS